MIPKPCSKNLKLCESPHSQNKIPKKETHGKVLEVFSLSHVVTHFQVTSRNISPMQCLGIITILFRWFCLSLGRKSKACHKSKGKVTTKGLPWLCSHSILQFNEFQSREKKLFNLTHLTFIIKGTKIWNFVYEISILFPHHLTIRNNFIKM